MGKPRLLIVIRHAQSEGNKNREIHQLIPDHRVKLTDDGWAQAEAAGHRLRALLRPDDTLQFYTSPYRRTRETTEGILRTLTSADTETGAPSPFSRNAVKVFEEPRIREQDFGNFQPCSSEMERMWQERADYGHFFYRIPNGESAADAYDRISGFNESLWRSFGEKDFPSVCVLVTHGLMTRVFLMKWYHWSVEYFEDLRNINHCEFIVMQQNLDNGKYVLQSQLRTWSELKRQRAEAEAAKKEPLPSPQRRNTLSQFLPNRAKANASPPPRSKWGGCVGGCNHNHDHYPRRNQRASKAAPASTAPVSASDTASLQPPPPAETGTLPPKPAGNEEDDTPASHAAPPVAVDDLSPKATSAQSSLPTPIPSHLLQGRDGGGTDSGAPTPHEPLSDQEQESDYFDPQHRLPKSAQAASASASTVVSPGARGPSHADQLDKALRGKKPRRKPTEEDLERWVSESGMGVGKRADALGDEPSDEGSDGGEDAVEEDEAQRRKELEGELERQEREDKSLRGSVY